MGNPGNPKIKKKTRKMFGTKSNPWFLRSFWDFQQKAKDLFLSFSKVFALLELFCLMFVFCFCCCCCAVFVLFFGLCLICLFDDLFFVFSFNLFLTSAFWGGVSTVNIH